MSKRIGGVPPPRARARDDQGRIIDEGAGYEAIAEAPESVLSKTATVAADAAALGDFEQVNLLELEKRIGLLTRIIIEAALRAPVFQMTLKDKADVALRAITVLEGSKQQIQWRDDMLRKPAPKSVEAYEEEMKQREARVMKLLMRRKEIQVRDAQLALDQVAQPADKDGNEAA